MIELLQGSIFDSKCDLLIIPCNDYGGVTSFVSRELLARELPYHGQFTSAGEVDFISDIGNFSNASVVGYASSVSVSERSSSEDIIQHIMEQIKDYCMEHSLKKINVPLLGTGAGNLSAKASFNAMKSVFENVYNMLLCVYALSNSRYHELAAYAYAIRQSNREVKINNPRVFISYTNVSPKNREWVKNLAIQLRKSGVDARLDIFHLKPGQDLAQWMTNEVIMADKVLLICDKYYASKADNKKGGVGWETMIIQGDMLSSQQSAKYIAILRDEDVDKSIPIYIRSRYSMNWTDESKSDEKFRELLFCLFDCDIAPEIGEIPEFIKSKLSNRNI